MTVILARTRFDGPTRTIGYQGIYYNVHIYKNHWVVYLAKDAITVPDWIKWKAQKRILEEYKFKVMIQLVEGRL